MSQLSLLPLLSCVTPAMPPCQKSTIYQSTTQPPFSSSCYQCLKLKLKPKFCPPSGCIIYYKVNRCLAKYSPRATTTSQPTNRAPNQGWAGMTFEGSGTGRELKKTHSRNSGTGREWKKSIPVIREREGNEKNPFPQFGNGNQRLSFPKILGNSNGNEKT